jgi:hypothetical protein
MASTFAGLNNYKAILVTHEPDYRQARGLERQELIKEIMEEMVAWSKGGLDEETMKGLGKVRLVQV